MDRSHSLARAGVLCFALTAAVAMPTAASAATGSRDQVAALKKSNRALTAQIASAKRLVGGTGSLVKRSSALRARLGGSGSASARALAIEATLGGSGTLAQRA
jgi:hypothetical protein